ncbi:hypothetical protein EVAR_68072_1 [Eumeta japonica]|uniref:Uncharacterized protein n=1 Tax=Eumeta variegata TaxID=151549 RepID=A0A4C1ZUC3_EUMVA|nr:hypothetical protein EVAR_68072_1 [Eumeta japonica]
MNAVLDMPGVTIEGSRDGESARPPLNVTAATHWALIGQLLCVRWGKDHLVADCPRPHDQRLTGANCHGPQLASDRRCPEGSSPALPIVMFVCSLDA